MDIQKRSTHLSANALANNGLTRMRKRRMLQKNGTEGSCIYQLQQLGKSSSVSCGVLPAYGWDTPVTLIRR